MAKKKETLEIEGRPLEVSNLDKVMFPKTGFTKGQVIDYYIRISPYLLPHLKNRPITMKRFPDGITGGHFYEKDAPSYTPKWINTFEVPRKNSKSTIHYIIINDLPALVWCANLANLEIHTFLARAPYSQRPDYVVFDLDPGPPANILNCAQVAFWVREILEKLKLKSWIKVSGSKGIQLYLPLNTGTDYETTGGFARALAQRLEELQPKLVVSNMSKDLRKGKVFIDWSQNSNFKTTVCVYSLRAMREIPYISMPVEWDELDKALLTGNEDQLYFEPDEALNRAEKLGELFEDVLKTKQRIPKNYAKALALIESVKEPVGKKKENNSKPLVKKYKAKRDFTQTTRYPPMTTAKSK